jgi:hypothetical protein
VGFVTVQIRTDNCPAAKGIVETVGDGSVRVSFDSVPGLTYRIQYTESLFTPDWQDVATQTADEYGVCEYIEWASTNAPAGFYRSVWP